MLKRDLKKSCMKVLCSYFSLGFALGFEGEQNEELRDKNLIV